MTAYDKLYDLETACRRYESARGDEFASWVFDSVAWYVCTDRAPRDFRNAFVSTPNARFPAIIRKCLAGDKSTDGMIKTFKKCIGYAEERSTL